MAIHRSADIYLAVDRERMTSLVSAAYDFIKDYLELASLHKSKEALLAEMSLILDSSRVATQFYLDFSSPKMNDFRIRVDPRRKELLGVTKRFEKHKNYINQFLRAL